MLYSILLTVMMMMVYNISKEKRQELERTVTMYNVMWTRWILFFVSSLFKVAFSFEVNQSKADSI